MNLPDLLRTSATQLPGKVALMFEARECTYAELWDQVGRVSAALSRRGIGRGDTVGLMLLNSPDFVVCLFAITGLGAAVVPLNVQLTPPEAAHPLKDARVKRIVCHSALQPVVRGALQLAGWECPVTVVGEEGTDSLVTLLSEEPGDWAPAPELDGETAAILYTSGTTGLPKGAMLSHHNLAWDAQACGQAIDVREDDVFLCALPMFHSFAITVCLLVPLLFGGSVSITPRFVPATVVEQMAQDGVTVMVAVPSMYAVLLKVPGEWTLPRLRLCATGGAGMPAELLAQVERRLGVIVVEGDGPTECGPVTCVNPPDQRRRPGSVGFPLPGVEMRIVDENDAPVVAGDTGEIVVRGPNVMKGYFNRPEATQEAMRGGWFHTGDLGKYDEDGFLYILDRKTDLIIVSGLNVYPRQVEDVLCRHPKVAEAAAVGQPDPVRGEVVRAVVALKPGEAATEAEIVRFCRQYLAPFKVPRRVEFRAELPKTGTGKINRRLLKP